VDASGRGGAVVEGELAPSPIATLPFARGALAHLGGSRRLGERPVLLDDAAGESSAVVQAERRVSVELHPVTSWGLGGWTPPASKEARMNNVLRN
jgi:hypothetical protein